MEQQRTNLDLDDGTLVANIAGGLDPTSRTPLYEQLAHAIGQAIRSGQLPAGAVLPREPDLAKRLGLSRQTVNQALTSLARRGLLRRRRGVGTFVADAYVEQPLDGLYSFIRTLTAQGRLPGTRLLGARVTLDDEASPLLTDRQDGLVFEVTRIRLVDGDPFVFEELYLPLECSESFPVDRLVSEVLYDLLRDLCGLVVTHAEETLRPVAVERTEAALLGLVAGDAAFRVERTSYAGDRAVEFRRSLIRGDRYRFRVRLDAAALLATRETLTP